MWTWDGFRENYNLHATRTVYNYFTITKPMTQEEQKYQEFRAMGYSHIEARELTFKHFEITYGRHNNN